MNLSYWVMIASSLIEGLLVTIITYYIFFRESKRDRRKDINSDIKGLEKTTTSIDNKLEKVEENSEDIGDLEETVDNHDTILSKHSNILIGIEGNEANPGITAMVSDIKQQLSRMEDNAINNGEVQDIRDRMATQEDIDNLYDKMVKSETVERLKDKVENKIDREKLEELREKPIEE